MQFLIVRAQLRDTKLLLNDLPVLIDGEENGVINNVLKLDEGTIEVSVKTDKESEAADFVELDLENTTQDQPMEVVVEVDAEHDTYTPVKDVPEADTYISEKSSEGEKNA